MQQRLALQLNDPRLYFDTLTFPWPYNSLHQPLRSFPHHSYSQPSLKYSISSLQNITISRLEVVKTFIRADRCHKGWIRRRFHWLIYSQLRAAHPLERTRIYAKCRFAFVGDCRGQFIRRRSSSGVLIGVYCYQCSLHHNILTPKWANDLFQGALAIKK